VDVRNDGELTAEHVKVRLWLPDTKREFEAVLPSVKSKEEVTLRFNLKRAPADKTVIVHMDPEDQILESDERNNRVERRHGFLGW
jgi:subtilase family serine protease